MRVRKSTWLPCLLLAYLALMCWIGRGELRQGHYFYYFGIVAMTLAAIAALRLFLRRRGK